MLKGKVTILNTALFSNPDDRESVGSFRKKPLRRGGCSAFGHSCFGGHGKRSDDSLLPPRKPFPPSEILRQWLQAYHNSSPILD